MSAGRKVKDTIKTWNTPPKYINSIVEMLNIIELDPCSNEYSMINSDVSYLLPSKDGLIESWDYKTIFVNPPYGRNSVRKTSIKNWLQKGAEANKKYNSEILFLIPVATNTSHFKEIIFKLRKVFVF